MKVIFLSFAVMLSISLYSQDIPEGSKKIEIATGLNETKNKKIAIRTLLQNGYLIDLEGMNYVQSRPNILPICNDCNIQWVFIAEDKKIFLWGALHYPSGKYMQIYLPHGSKQGVGPKLTALFNEMNRLAMHIRGKKTYLE